MSLITNLHLESCTIPISITYLSNHPHIPCLYIDQYFTYSDNELPSQHKNYTIAFLQQTPTSNNNYSIFKSALSDSIIFRALDGESPNIFYILQAVFNDTIQTLLIEFPFKDIQPNFSTLLSFFSCRAEAIETKYSTFNWLENYYKSLSEWINYSAIQKTKILSISTEIKEKSEKQNSNANYSKNFGECLLCCERNRNIVFLPCGHMVTCLQCAVRKLKVEITTDTPRSETLPHCPICKRGIENAVETFS